MPTPKTLSKRDQLMQDLLCNAFEGGANYWYRIDEFNYPAGRSKADVEFPHLELPFIGGSLEVTDACNDEGKINYRKTVDHAALVAGMQIMHDKFPRHYGNAIAENHDAETGDVFLQCVVMGDIIYG